MHEKNAFDWNLRYIPQGTYFLLTTSKNATTPFAITTWLNFCILHVHVTVFILDTDKHVFWQTVKIQMKPTEGGISS